MAAAVTVSEVVNELGRAHQPLIPPVVELLKGIPALTEAEE